MSIFNKMNRATKLVLGAGLVLIVYGYLSRMGIYFFWESRAIGWDFFFVGLLLFLISLRKAKKRDKKKAVGEGIGIGLVIFILFVRAIFYVVLPRTDAYQAAETYLLNNDSLQRETGRIKGIGFVPGGNIAVENEAGQAFLSLIIKGEKKYKEVQLYVGKEPGSGWRVEGVEQ